MRARAVIVAGVVSFGALVFGVAPAGAATGYGNVCPSLATAFCAGVFSEPLGVAVDNSSGATKGDVYLVEYPGKRVLKYDKEGSSLGEIALPSSSVPLFDAVDPANGEIYISDIGTGTVTKLEPSGTAVAGFGVEGQVTVAAPTGVGVDPTTDDLFVASRNGNIYQFDGTTGAEIGSFPTLGVREAADSLAVNAAGDVYLVDENAQILEYPAANRAEPKVLDANPSGAVAIDPSTEQPYVADNTGLGPEIEVFEGSSGKLISTFGSGTLGSFGASGSYGLGVYGETHDVYAANRSGGLGVIYEEGPTPETQLTEAATSVTGVTAVLHGELNPGAQGKAGWYFAYNVGGTCTGGSTTPVEAEAKAQAVNESREIVGLEPNTAYTFCFVAKNPFGQAEGGVQQFKTSSLPPVVDTESATSITAFDAILSAQINPENQTTMCLFEYGLTNEAHGSVAACPGELNGFGDQDTSVDLGGGLKPGTVYYYRVVGENAAHEKTEGALQSFRTNGLPVLNAEAHGASRTGVLLSGTVNAEGADTHYYFEYGTTNGYGQRTSFTDAGSGLGVQTIPTVVVSGLLPGIVYHYTLLATNEAGTTESPDATFTTAPPTPPIVTTGPASKVSQSTATVAATINAQGLPATYGFEIGTSSNDYGPRTGLGSIAAEGALATVVSLSLTGLQPASTYYYRITATNIDGTTYGTDETFTTSTFTNVFATPPPVSPFVGIPSIAFPTEAGTATPTTKVLTNAQKLSNALKVCKRRPRKQRAACEKRARKRYGVKRRALPPPSRGT